MGLSKEPVWEMGGVYRALIFFLFLSGSTFASIGIEKVIIEDFEICVDANDNTFCAKNLSFEIEKKADSNNVKFKLSNSVRPDFLRVNGEVDYESFFSFIEFRTNTSFEGSDLGQKYQIPTLEDYALAGRIITDVNLHGPVKTPEKLGGAGNITAENLSLFYRDEPIVEELSGRVLFDRNVLNIENVNGEICSGSLHIRTTQSSQLPALSKGIIRLERVNAKCLAERFGVTNELAEGIVSLRVEWTIDGLDIIDPNFEGVVTLADADISLLPLVRSLYSFLGIRGLTPLRKSDVFIMFKTNGSLITINEGRITNTVSAIIIEPGGTFDVETREIDIYLIAAPFKNIDSVLRKIPVLSAFAAFGDKLTRIRVQGNLKDSETSLLSKQPAEDVGKAGIAFFEEALNSGGEMPKIVMIGAKKFSGLFKIFD
jgi:hypothetical protein